jgi:CBS domain-containing protein
MDLLPLARPPVLVTRAMPVREAAQLMMDREVGALVVIDGKEHPIGIFTEKDLLTRVVCAGRHPDITLIGEVMSAPLQTAPATIKAEDGLKKMIQHHFRHLPIVDMNHRVIAIASLRHLLMRRIGEKQASLETLAAYVEAGGPG